VQAKVDNSMCAVADPRPMPRYLVLSAAQTRAIIDGFVPLPFAIVDSAEPARALATLDDWDKPAYRLEQRVMARGKVEEQRVPVPVWMISEDGTCHRELTTL
jgi:hypothetical protein